MSELDLSHGKYINKNWVSESTQIFMPMSGISKTFRDEILENSENDILLSNKKVISMDGSDVSVIFFGIGRGHTCTRSKNIQLCGMIFMIFLITVLIQCINNV